jgi:hypothetical protein
MSGKTALQEVLEGVGEISRLAVEMAELEEKLSHELSEDEMTATLDRYGDVRRRYSARTGSSQHFAGRRRLLYRIPSS